MAQTTIPPEGTQKDPAWRVLFNYLFDVRVLGVLGQIGFIVIVVLFFQAIGGNFAENANRLGESQFICRDGSFSYRCAYDFMDSEAGFDVSDTVGDISNTDPYWAVFYQGVLNTLRVAVLGVVLTSIVGTVAGIARLSENWLLSKLALWYVEIVRNTPLLIQLFFIYFGVILAAPSLENAIQPLGLPIYLSQRGLNMPSFEFTSSASIWVAFLVLGIIQFQVMWVILGRREERTGQSSNRIQAGILSFLVVVGIGWVVSSSVSDTQGLMTPNSSRIREIDDMETLIVRRSNVNYLEELDNFSPEEIDEVAFRICAIENSASEANLTRHLRAKNIPYVMVRSVRPDQATDDYAAGDCEMYAATKSILAAERSTLENLDSNSIISVPENPVVWSLPNLEGLNIVGGSSLKPEFTALLLTLVLFYGGLLAEIVRAGIQSVSKGQSEAARALGLTEGQRLQLIVLPQALRVIIPPGIGVFLSLAKDTSVGIAIGFPDMYSVSFTTMNQSGRTLQLFILMMLVYMLISLVFSVLLNWYNDRIKLVER